MLLCPSYDLVSRYIAVVIARGVATVAGGFGNNRGFIFHQNRTVKHQASSTKASNRETVNT